jgi:hypothetical protein
MTALHFLIAGCAWFVVVILATAAGFRWHAIKPTGERQSQALPSDSAQKTRVRPDQIIVHHRSASK